MIAEKRQYTRVKWSIEDGFFGNFQLPDGLSVNAPLLNLSAGGLNCAMMMSDSERIRPGNELVLVKIFGATNFLLEGRVKVQVIWIGKPEDGGRVPVGCRFLDLDQLQQTTIQSFVDEERFVRGQYD